MTERGRDLSWSSSHRGTEYRLIITAVVGLCGVGVAGSVVPGVDATVGAVLIAGLAVALGMAVVRRELRIRRRLADVDGTRYASRPSGGASRTRVGPGDDAPVPPAPIRRPARALTVVPISPSASAVASPRTPTGGAA
ncbi:hypothetical protein [Pseudonocardia sp.]|jgi:hypothetical protein|uniref:hypothetical protein n=1 Tax=Pseudonocardia sp. TaxID=60912 RepID=UPI00261AA092|nr:hypothetical protein [Pseudonocardia sp.]MCW2720612.1 hypothetical protein [Pseudonocardia sp.]